MKKRPFPFSIFADNIKNRFVVYLDYIPLPAKCLKGKQREGSTQLKESHNNHFKLSTYIFLRIFFSSKIAAYYKIFSGATTRKFCKILSNVTSWRSAMILKNTLRAFFYNFLKQFHNSNSQGRLLLILIIRSLLIETQKFSTSVQFTTLLVKAVWAWANSLLITKNKVK